GEFVQDADSDPKSPALARAIVAMGRSMSMATVAEGIETASQTASMRALGCTYGQGYFFSMPLSSDDVVAAFAREGLSGERRATAAAGPGRTAGRARRLGITRTSPAGCPGPRKLTLRPPEPTGRAPPCSIHTPCAWIRQSHAPHVCSVG